MCDWKIGRPPPSTRSLDSAISGRTKPSSLFFGQWSVCSAMFTGYFAATTCANSAIATAPVTISLTPVPEANSAPPVDTWMIPSLPASAAFTVSDDVTLIAGYAKPSAFARSSMWA